MDPCNSKKADCPHVAVVGAGVIGRSWIRVFIRAGCETRVYDVDPVTQAKSLKWVEEDLALDCRDGVMTKREASEQRALVSAHDDLAAALRGVDYVQESGPEVLEMKESIYLEMDRTAAPDVILASSTSGLDMTEIAHGLPGAKRCIIVHPVNPPHIIPIVEVLPGKCTSPEVVGRACSFLSSVGQTPVMLNFFIRGFLLNRMQAAILREAIQLVESGVADVEAVDATIRDGLGLRWAIMGPFGVADTNADGGVREYFTRFRDFYLTHMNDLAPTPLLDDAMIERLGRATDRMVGSTSRAGICRWRDRMITRIRELKELDPEPSETVGRRPQRSAL
jgi:L-gulonate 3-dehydrogenase